MNTTLFRAGLASFAAAALLIAAPAFAEMQTCKATLTSAAEVPPNASKGTGTLASTHDTATKKLTRTVTFSGLSGPATAAHFHGPAAAGANAGVVVPQEGRIDEPDEGRGYPDRRAGRRPAGRQVVFQLSTPRPTRAAPRSTAAPAMK